MKPFVHAAAAAILLSATVPAAAADVAVWRGGVAGAGIPHGATAHGVTEIRGSVAAPAAETSVPAVRAHAGPLVAAGKSRLWLVDPASGRVTVCRDVHTSFVGGWQIVCRSTALDL